MSTLTQLREHIQKERSNSEYAREYDESIALLKQLKEEEAILVRQVKDELAGKLELNRDSQKNLESEIAESWKKINSQKERLNKLIDQIGFPHDTISELPANVPILLFPLRLETRFKTVGSGTSAKNELWLRAYPDDCQVTHREPGLTSVEIKNVRAFWCGFFAALGNEAGEKAAWRSLVKAHGVGRATWIHDQFKPKPVTLTVSDKQYLLIPADSTLNEANRSLLKIFWTQLWNQNGIGYDELIRTTAGLTREIPNHEPWNFFELVKAKEPGTLCDVTFIDFPEESSLTIKPATWTKPAVASTLPDRLVAIIQRKGNDDRIIPFPHAIRDTLQVGPDPSLPQNESLRMEEGELAINTELQWMIDFEKAIDAGMGVKIELNPAEAGGFDRLLVLGLRLSADETESKNTLERLIKDHLMGSTGFELLSQGTPTNNTEDSPSGYTWAEDPDQSFYTVVKGRNAIDISLDEKNRQDGKCLADALGIDPEMLNKAAHASGRDQAEAKAMNTALWPATAGFFLEEMMDGLVNPRYIDQARSFFIDYVSGRGPIPAIRIGRQPYGILPTSVFSRLSIFDRDEMAHNMKVGPSIKSGKSFYVVLKDLLEKLQEPLAKAPVPHVGQGGDPHDALIKIIGLQSGSAEFFQRFAQSDAHLLNLAILMMGGSVAGPISKAMRDKANKILSDLGYNMASPDLAPDIPILKKYFVDQANSLKGPLIDDLALSETSSIRPYASDKNYLTWLSESGFETIRKLDFGNATPPNALLFLLLRQAVLQSFGKTGANLIPGSFTYRDPDFIHVQAGDTVAGKFAMMYSLQPELTGTPDGRLVDFVDSESVIKNRSEAAHLRETRDAIKKLEFVPTARLERLFTEHVDCCSYRFDAWKTGLVSRKLTDYRDEVREGIFLGAYGWLEDLKPKGANLAAVPDKQRYAPGGAGSVLSDSANLGYIHAPSLDQAATAAILRNAYQAHKGQGAYEINLSSSRVRQAQDILEGIRNGISLSAMLGYQFERGLHEANQSERLGDIGIEADKFIYPLRKKFPLVANNISETAAFGLEAEKMINMNVLDGLKLVKRIQEKQENAVYPFGFTTGSKSDDLPAASPEELAFITEQVDRILDMNDSVSDLILAEQVYQTVRGNMDRAAAVEKSFSQGNYPPEIEVTNTPRTGSTITHRVVIQFKANAAIPTLATPRAKTEPAVNEWLKQVLPPFDMVYCKVELAEGSVSTPVKMFLNQLGLLPIDVLHIFNFDGEQSMKELDDRIVYHIRHGASNISAPVVKLATQIKIKYLDNEDPTKVSFFEMASLVKNLRKILISAKVLSHEDSMVGEKDKGSAFKFEELLTRLDSAKAELESYRSELNFAPDASIDDTVEKAGGLFLKGRLFGIQQGGYGFIHSSVSAIHRSIEAKSVKVAERWREKDLDYRKLKVEYDGATSDDDRLTLLQKMERRISSSSTFPLPIKTSGEVDLVELARIVTEKKSEFDSAKLELDRLPAGSSTSNHLFTAAESIVSKIPDFDVVSFDIDNNANTIDQEKKMSENLKAEIVKMAELIKLEINKRIESYSAQTAKAAGLSGSAKLEAYLHASRQVLGEEAIVLARFQRSVEARTEFQKCYLDQDMVTRYASGSALPLEDWMISVSKVREKMNHLQQVRSLVEIFDINPLQLHALQFPFTENDRWLALKFRDNPNEYTIDTDKILFTGVFATDFDKTDDQCGIVIDEWTEVVPGAEETTGIAFHYDQPSSEPPQVILLSVAPGTSASWTWEDLKESVVEAFDMAKLRGVEPEAIDQYPYAQFLPATVFPAARKPMTFMVDLDSNNESIRIKP
ncbi:MAG: hypothetical protein ACK5DD_00650 [Cyclobacteriaceae bacterium]|jgi:hypothetical protein